MIEQTVASFRRDLELTGAAGIALLVLFLGVMTNRYRFEGSPLRPHTEHLALLIALALLAFLVIQKGARISFHKSDVLLGAYLGVAFFASLSFPMEPRESVQYWVRMVLSVAVYYVARWLMSEHQTSAFRLALKALLLFGVLEALFGIVSWFLYPLGINLGVDEYPLGIRGPGGILCNFSLTMYGTLWEPNVFASTLMLVILVGGTLFISNEFVVWRKFLGIALAIILIAMGLNASRGAFFTLVLGLVLIVLFAKGMSLFRKIKWAMAAVLLVLIVYVPSQEMSRVLMQLPSARGLAQRAPCAEWIAKGMPRGMQEGDPVVDPPTGPDSELNVINRVWEQQTLVSRWVSYKNAWDDFVQHPMFGNGANSFGQKYTTTAHTPGWISNLTLMALHDTGLVGTAILLVWFVWFAWMSFRAWRRAPSDASSLTPRIPDFMSDDASSSLRTMALALGIGLVCLFVAYQVTTMLWFGMMWYLLAVMETGACALKVGNG